RGRRAEAQQEFLLPRLRLGEIVHLDVAIAADLIGEGRELDRERMVVLAEIADDLVDDGLVVADEPAFGSPLLAAREGIERRAAEEAQLGEHSEDAQHPRSV